MKKIALLFNALLISTLSIAQTGLVAHYRMDGSLADTVSNNDLQNFGAVAGADRFSTAGESYSFNGLDQNMKAFNPTFKNDSVGSISIWFKIDSLGGTQYITSIGDTSNMALNYISLLRLDPTDTVVGIYYRDQFSANFVNGTTKLQMNTYYHVVLTANRTSWDFYINGVKDSTVIVAGSNLGLWFSDLSSFINAYVVGSNIANAFFDGQIDDIKIYNVALDSAAVADLYNDELTNTIPNGISELNVINSIYPNPVIDFIYVKGLNQSTEYAIFSIDGSLIDKGNLLSDRIDASELAKGVYFLKLNSEIGTSTSKFIKQ